MMATSTTRLLCAIRAGAVLLLLVFTQGSRAQETERPPWLSDEVVAAALAIGMTDEQLGPFRASVAAFLQTYRDDARRIIRRGDAGIETQLQRALSTAARQMDKQMAAFLTDDQMVPYQHYREALLDSVTPE